MAELTLVLETLVDLCYAKMMMTGGPFMASLVSEKAVVNRASMAFMPKCPITPTGSERSSTPNSAPTQNS